MFGSMYFAEVEFASEFLIVIPAIPTTPGPHDVGRIFRVNKHMVSVRSPLDDHVAILETDGRSGKIRRMDGDSPMIASVRTPRGRLHP